MEGSMFFLPTSSKDVPSPSIDDSECSDPVFEMVDMSDDEETIAQEELMEPEVDPQEELRMLAQDLEVSVEELTAKSGSQRSRRSHKKVDYQAMLLEETMKKKQTMDCSDDSNVILQQPRTLAESCSRLLQSEDESEAGPSTKSDTFDHGPSELTKFYLNNSYCSIEDEETDADYAPMLRPMFAQKIREGSSYQAEIPDACAMNECVAGAADDKSCDSLLWKPPPNLSEEDVKSYLSRVNRIEQQLNSKACSNRETPKDDEQALEILLQCNYNKGLALAIYEQKLHHGENIENQTHNFKENEEKESVSRENEYGANVPKLRKVQ